jgi:hypothetical protein
VAVFAARLLLEDRFRPAFSEAAPLLEPALVLEEFDVELAATAPSDAVVLFAAVPTPPELLPPPEEVLVSVELPYVFAVPLAPAAARFAVEPEVDVLLCEFDMFAEVARVPAAV